MATTSSLSSTNSFGLDTAALVEQLMTVERQPLTRLQQDEQSYQSKISALSTLLNGASALKDAVADLKGSSLMSYKTTVSDDSLLTASSASGATSGTYNVTINQRALAHSIATAAASPYSALTSPVADLGGASEQYLNISVGPGSPVRVTINSSNNTLQGVKDAINSANAGVRASVVQTGANAYRLVLTSNTSGAANKITIGADLNGGNAGVDSLAYDGSSDSGAMERLQAARDASITVDGLTVTRATNTISDVIPGVTLNLLKDTGSANVTIGGDNDALKTKVNSFITAYNSLKTSIKQLKGTVDASGTLSGESLLNSISDALRRLGSTPFNGNYLSSMGITVDKSGVMSLDSTRFDAAVSSDSANVTSTLNAFGNSFEQTMYSFINDSIPARTSGYQATITRIKKSEVDLTERLDLVEAGLKQRYAALDATLGKLQSTSSFITAQLAQLSKSS